MLAAALALTGCMVVPGGIAVPVAHADIRDDIAAAQRDQTASVQAERELRARLSGVRSDLADTIVQLDHLTNALIPEAQSRVTQAQETAAQAEEAAQAAASRLEAAQRDKEHLEALIEQTGEDYDDARAAVALLARESMKGGAASDVMAVVTGSTSSEEFVSSMQAHDVLSRIESNNASDAAVTVSTSMNRRERVAAMEDRIAELQRDADAKAAQAVEQVAAAQSERDALETLRAQGEQTRQELERDFDSISDAAARQAAETVLLQSRIDGYNSQYAQQQAQSSGQVNSGQQGTTSQQPSGTGGGAATPSTPPSSGSGSGSSSASGGQGTHNGDVGNRYYAGQCTWYAYNRRAQMGIGTPSLLGNGGEWYLTAPAFGLRVDHTPQVGAALSFLPGQDGADGVFGHVAVVEAVYADGTFLISEMNWGGLYLTHSRILTNRGQYWFVH